MHFLTCPLPKGEEEPLILRLQKMVGRLVLMSSYIFLVLNLKFLFCEKGMFLVYIRPLPEGGLFSFQCFVVLFLVFLLLFLLRFEMGNCFHKHDSIDCIMPYVDCAITT